MQAEQFHPRLTTWRQGLLRLHQIFLAIDQSIWEVRIDEPLSRFESYVLILEDRRFFKHFGWSFKDSIRELARFLLRKPHGGASTIDMQLFRVVSNRYERTLGRKVFEIMGSILMQWRYSKSEILRVYLLKAYFGTELVGAENASRQLYGSDTRGLSHENASKLAALLVYPKPRVPNANWTAKVARRADYARRLVAAHEQEFQKLNII